MYIETKIIKYQPKIYSMYIWNILSLINLNSNYIDELRLSSLIKTSKLLSN